MNTMFKATACAVGLCVIPAVSQAAIIEFDFTGRLIVANTSGTIIENDPLTLTDTYTDIAASLTYDTSEGIGNSALSVTMNGDNFLGFPPTFHDIEIKRVGSSQYIAGVILVDWAGNNNLPVHVEWDAAGLFNAIDYGIQAGDVLSGSTLYRDYNGNGVFDNGEFLTDIASATPYSDFLLPSNPNYTHLPGGPAPMAATSGSKGVGYDIAGESIGTSSGLEDIKGYFDIGTGNSMHVTSVSEVPVPAAVWLFGSRLLALIGMSRRRIDDK